MKTLAIGIVLYLLFFTDVLPFVHFESWQLPLWIADISWTGLELVGVLVAIIIVAAVAGLLAMGVVGAFLVAFAGVVLACLFGSIMIFWPLLLAAILYWLISDNKKVLS
ncbi:hypothetical protein J8L70_06760 [Pseudoalteromonas sp. MMG010]|uniref:hypothetical protein n=1 Tax=Pseudoalteromonas sp. MMG010 TaxID=2822685 RepID=UPI001B3A5BF1|nr:hypothetical protein [Pseudoalteromonas sp. MMG010]MBQ4832937.1 hypothetical protein [Pseudoalteromonas sp. MMG010]